MLSKKEHISYWVTTAEEDLARAQILFDKSDYVFSLFCLCLSIEKMSKALWVCENANNYPPRIHEVKYIISDTSFVPDGIQSLFIDTIQKYQIEGRYPDYKKLIYSYTTKEYTAKLFEEGKEFLTCLQNKLSLKV